MKQRKLKDLRLSIGTFIKKGRIKKGLTQEELAGKVGVTRASIANTEAGRQRLGLETMVLVCRVLDLSSKNILKGY